MDTVGANIRGLRELSGWSQRELAEKLGVTRSAVSLYESGRAYPKMTILEKMAFVFGVSVADLVYDGEPRFYAGDLTNAEYDLIACYRSMSPRFRAALMETARAMSDDGQAKNNDVSRVG